CPGPDTPRPADRAFRATAPRRAEWLGPRAADTRSASDAPPGRRLTPSPATVRSAARQPESGPAGRPVRHERAAPGAGPLRYALRARPDRMAWPQSRPRRA